ncbi:MAG: acetyl-CoA carboxylase biotin carboxyl carrier protein [Nitrospiraceae bacterium]|nr:acetyl-CoA carboxylase biotin carboxyl carrier protein [Nitrospiraceae bacterium]
MELEDIKALLELLRDTDVAEIEVEKEGSRVKIRRGRFYTSVELPSAPPQIKHEEAEEERLITVTAPLVGTFYRAPSPEASVFVEVGSVVKKGQVLCIVEAMKLMNEIESEIDGQIVKILAENGQPVEYGEPLFLIEPAAR